MPMMTDDEIAASVASMTQSLRETMLSPDAGPLRMNEKQVEAAARVYEKSLEIARANAIAKQGAALDRDGILQTCALTLVTAQQLALLTASVGALAARIERACGGANDDPEVTALLAGALSTEKIAERIVADYGPMPRCDGCRRSSPAACYHHARCADCRQAEESRKPGRPWRDGYCPKHRRA
jgi:hypothetical protein